MVRISNFELAYLAGFFDGEGCVHINKPDRGGRQNLLIRVSQTDPRVLLAFEARWGGKITTRDNGPNRKPIWLWTACSYSARECLSDLYPYLRMKVAQAEIAIRFQSLKEGDNDLRAHKLSHPRREEILHERQECHRELSILNKRGAR